MSAENLELHGIHHLTAITADISRNHAFYTGTLGMRLVKKSVNQDDVSAYHLFYADGEATPGTDLTFFDWPMPREIRGTHSISRTGLRVAGESSLKWWADHLSRQGVRTDAIKERDGRRVLDFEDWEGQRFSLVDDGGAGSAHPWAKSTIPPEYQIRGLGPITITIPLLARSEPVFTQVMNLRPVRQYDNVHVYAMGPAGGAAGGAASSGGRGAVASASAGGHGGLAASVGPAAELHVAIDDNAPFARQGAGGVHHVAFRVPDEAQYHAWAERLNSLGIGNSGEVDRFYFRSLYFREPSGILFELATDGPGFATDEPMETLGEKLALPPFLEGQRAEIEANLKPLV